MKAKQKLIVICLIILSMSLIYLLFQKNILMNNVKTEKRYSLTDVKDELRNYKFSEHDNLKFTCEIPKIETDQLYSITMKAPAPPTISTENNLRKLMSIITPLDFSDVEAEYLYNTITNEPFVVQLNYDGDRISPGGELYENSNTFYCRNIDRSKNDKVDFGKSYKRIDVFDVNAMKEKFQLNETDRMSVNEADKFITNELDKIKKGGFFNEDETFQLKKCLIEKYDNYDHIVLRYEHIFHGLPVDVDGFVDPYNENGEIRPSYIDVILTGKNEYMYLCNKYYYTPKEFENIDKIISLSQAEELVTTGLAANLKYDVLEADLKYCCYLKETDGEFVYKPMWFFLLKDDMGEDFTNYYSTLAVYIDAVTGDFYYCDSANYSLSIK